MPHQSLLVWNDYELTMIDLKLHILVDEFRLKGLRLKVMVTTLILLKNRF